MNNTQFLKQHSGLVGNANGFPVVMCWRISIYQVAFWCPFCNRPHFHGWANGAPDGHRATHCYNETPFSRTGYILKCVGTLFEDLLVEVEQCLKPKHFA